LTPTTKSTELQTVIPSKNPSELTTVIPTLNRSVPPYYSPTDHSTDSAVPLQKCIPKVLDFSGLSNGQYIVDELMTSRCVTIAAFANKRNGVRRGFSPIGGVHQPSGGAARAFDTGIGSNCEDDLLTTSPKIFCGPEFVHLVAC
jgi:hypothetical protein